MAGSRRMLIMPLLSRAQPNEEQPKSVIALARSFSTFLIFFFGTLGRARCRFRAVGAAGRSGVFLLGGLVCGRCAVALAFVLWQILGDRVNLVARVDLLVADKVGGCTYDAIPTRATTATREAHRVFARVIVFRSVGILTKHAGCTRPARLRGETPLELARQAACVEGRLALVASKLLKHALGNVDVVATESYVVAIEY